MLRSVCNEHAKKIQLFVKDKFQFNMKNLTSSQKLSIQHIQLQ